MQKHMGCCGLKFSVTTAAKSSYRGNRKRSLTPLSRLHYSFMLNTNSSGILLPNVVSFHILNLLKEARLCYMLCSIECEGSGIYITPVLKHLQTGMQSLIFLLATAKAELCVAEQLECSTVPCVTDPLVTSRFAVDLVW